MIEQTFTLIRQSHRILILAAGLVGVLLFASTYSPDKAKQELKLVYDIFGSPSTFDAQAEYIGPMIERYLKQVHDDGVEVLKTYNNDWKGDLYITIDVPIEIPSHSTTVSGVLSFLNEFRYFPYLVINMLQRVVNKYNYLTTKPNSKLKALMTQVDSESSVSLSINYQSFSDGTFFSVCRSKLYGTYPYQFRICPVYPNKTNEAVKYSYPSRAYTRGSVFSSFTITIDKEKISSTEIKPDLGKEKKYEYPELVDGEDEPLKLARASNVKAQFYPDYSPLLYFDHLYKFNQKSSLGEFSETIESKLDGPLDNIQLPFAINIGGNRVVHLFPLVFTLLTYYSYVHLQHLTTVVHRIDNIDDTYYPVAILSSMPYTFEVTVIITFTASLLPLISTAINGVEIFKSLTPLGFFLYIMSSVAVICYCIKLRTTRNALFERRSALENPA